MSCLCNFILIFCLLSEWCMQWFRSHDSSRCKQCCLCTSVSLQDPDLQLDERVSEAAAVLPLTAKRELVTTHVKLTASAQRSDLTVTHSAALHHVNQTPDRETERYMLRSNDPGSFSCDVFINAWQWVCCFSRTSSCQTDVVSVRSHTERDSLSSVCWSFWVCSQNRPVEGQTTRVSERV